MDQIRDLSRHYKASALFLIALSLVLASLTGVSAQESQNKLNVEVNISERTIIDIQPKKFAWGVGTDTVTPGSLAGPNQENKSYGRIQVENLGSVNLTQIWYNTSYPTQRPFGTGNPSNYNSGNFVALDSNDSTVTDTNQFVNRVEYGLDQPNDQDIIYLSTPGDWDYGRFRNTSFEYFWTVDDTGADLVGATLRVGVTPHTESQTGSTALDSACQYGDGSEAGSNTECNAYSLTQVTDGSGNNWGVTEVEFGAQDDTTDIGSDGGEVYCAAFDESSTIAGSGTKPEAHFIKYNPQHPAVAAAGGGSDCAFAANYTIGDQSGETLVPGDWVVWNIRAKIPYGVPAGQLPSGELFVLANSG